MLFIVPSLSTSGWKAVSMVMLRLNEFGAAGRDCLCWDRLRPSVAPAGPDSTVLLGGSGLGGAAVCLFITVGPGPMKKL